MYSKIRSARKVQYKKLLGGGGNAAKLKSNQRSPKILSRIKTGEKTFEPGKADEIKVNNQIKRKKLSQESRPKKRMRRGDWDLGNPMESANVWETVRRQTTAQKEIANQNLRNPCAVLCQSRESTSELAPASAKGAVGGAVITCEVVVVSSGDGVVALLAVAHLLHKLLQLHGLAHVALEWGKRRKKAISFPEYRFHPQGGKATKKRQTHFLFLFRVYIG